MRLARLYSRYKGPKKLPMLFESLRKSRFWLEWQRKFEGNANTVWIQPNSKAAKRVASEAIRTTSTTPLQKANDIWRWVSNNIDYKLRKEWQPPDDLLARGSGDCEDISFLIASALHSSGVKNSTLSIGYVIGPNGEQEPHVWNTVQGEVIDGTVPYNNDKPISYEIIEEYQIQTAEQ